MFWQPCFNADPPFYIEQSGEGPGTRWHCIIVRVSHNALEFTLKLENEIEDKFHTNLDIIEELKLHRLFYGSEHCISQTHSAFT